MRDRTYLAFERRTQAEFYMRRHHLDKWCRVMFITKDDMDRINEGLTALSPPIPLTEYEKYYIYHKRNNRLLMEDYQITERINRRK